MPSLRDTGRQRMYSAERTAFGDPLVDVLRVSKYAQRYLVDDTRGPTFDYPSVAATQAYVDAVRTSAVFQRRWGYQALTVEAGHGGTSRGGFGYLTMSAGHRRHEETILHEIAHNVVRPAHTHGPAFAATLLELVKIVMGPEHAARLRAAYAEHRIKYRAGLAHVPAASEGRLARARLVRVKAPVAPRPLATPRAARKPAPEVVGYDASYLKGWGSGQRGADWDAEYAFQRRHPNGDVDAWGDGFLDALACRDKWHSRDCGSHFNGPGGCGVA